MDLHLGGDSVSKSCIFKQVCQANFEKKTVSFNLFQHFPTSVVVLVVVLVLVVAFLLACCCWLVACGWTINRRSAIASAPPSGFGAATARRVGGAEGGGGRGFQESEGLAAANVMENLGYNLAGFEDFEVHLGYNLAFWGKC